MFHGFLLLGGKKCQQLFSCTGRGGELGSKAGLLVFITLKKNAQEFGKGEQRTGAQNRNGWRPAYVLAAFFRVLFRSRFVFSLEQRPGGDRIPFFVTLAHCVPSAIPLSAFSLTHLKSSNNNKGFKVSPWNCGAHRIPYRGAHFSQ